MSPPPSDKISECQRVICDENVREMSFSVMCGAVPRLGQLGLCLRMKPQLNVLHLKVESPLESSLTSLTSI